MVNLKAKGQFGEKLAEKWLENNGFRIIAHNVKVGRIGEIDLICQKDNVYYFVEVKASFREDPDFPPEFRFTKQKFTKIVKMSSLIANQNNYPKWRVALLSLSIKSGNVKVRFYPDV